MEPAVTNSFWATPGGWTLITVGQVLLVMVGVLISLAFLLLADRKIWAGVQMRKGPNVVGPFGLLQSFADQAAIAVQNARLYQDAVRERERLHAIIEQSADGVMIFDELWRITNFNRAMERLTMSRCARNRIDGRGGDRVVNGMEIMLHAPSRAVPAAAVAA